MGINKEDPVRSGCHHPVLLPRSISTLVPPGTRQSDPGLFCPFQMVFKFKSYNLVR